MSWVLTNTAMALAAALVVAITLRFTRPRPAFAHALWALVLLRLCLPPGCAWELAVPLPEAAAPVAEPLRLDLAASDLDAGANALPPSASLRTAAVPNSAVPNVELANAELPSGAFEGPLPAPAASTLAVAPSNERPTATAIALAWLPTAWLAGSALCALFAAVGIARGMHRFGAAPAPAAWVEAEVRALAARLAVRAPRVVDDARATTPFVWPFVLPFGGARLVVSSEALAAMAPGARAAVLGHELGHLLRRDHWWLAVELLLAIAFFWHPLFWLVRARMREQAELACDAWALAAAPDARRPYARALIDALAQDHPAPAVPVLAARPAARRLIERRLSMILHESVPCRLSRLWLAGLATLSLGLVVAPVRAQQRGEAPRVEIRVDGVKLEELSPKQRARVLKQLGISGAALEQLTPAKHAEPAEEPVEEPAEAQDPEPKPHKAKAPKAPKAPKPPKAPKHADGEAIDLSGVDLGDLSGEVQQELHAALAEAKAELASDDDLRELGIADEVGSLIDAIGGKGNFQHSLDAVIGAALKGAAKKAKQEIAKDEDLQRMGLAGSIGNLIDGLADNEQFRKGLMQFAHQAMHSALQEAKADVAGDADLQQLGIGDDVAAMLDDLGRGEMKLDEHLPALIQKAMQGAMKNAKVEVESGDDDEDEEHEEADEAEAKAAAKAAAKQAKADAKAKAKAEAKAKGKRRSV